MPPRGPPGSGGGGRGRGRGQGPVTGRGAPRGAGPRGGGPLGTTRTAAPMVGLPDTASHITTIGVKRPAFGQSGRRLTVFTNHFEVSIPQDTIHHYDGVFVFLLRVFLLF